MEEHDLPPGCGFKMFGIEHILMLVVIVVLIVAAAFLFRKPSDGGRVIMMRVIAVLLLFLEVVKIVILAASGRMDRGYLPLHLCSMAIFIYPVIAFIPAGRVRDTLAEISVITLLPAAVCACVFPDWTMYPILNFYSLHAFVWHSLQMLFPILCVMNGWISPRVRNLWKSTVFLLAYGLVVGLFDWRFSCNYGFLKHPVSGTPLEWLHGVVGPKLYLVSLLVLATVVNLGMYGVMHLIIDTKTWTRDSSEDVI